ncbi:hypothetical protein TraAM80_08925 [Trypanosoma rangeli]|uniref:Transmembrane protein 42 n=1 Tax=Trypanosoma rangeli TaxID=5698 RepID=A0A3R7KNK3_TRYRA|nr:uncharacterized protein TraAM80_08925 [Trypanosoma rangeli]RNE98184.1 hypothetical protein TraAM80_08925 [Trypanosoma rangeli]|eukprot:RNE98184.1 hypothetical protein TraAM80_08925 [Trypanosoma rangeli]
MGQEKSASPHGREVSVECRSPLHTREKRQPSSTASRAFFLHASLAGMFGALSAVVGKLAVTESGGKSPITAVASFSVWANLNHADSWWAHVALLGIRGLLFASNIFFTAQMWRWYLKALSCGPTPVCQILNTGTNFAVSALLGFVVFHEEITAMWAVGALLVVAGLAVIVSDARVSAQ